MVPSSRSSARSCFGLLFLLVLFAGGESPLQAQLFLSPIDTLVPMRDGQELALDLYLPDGPGPFPTILIQTPYNKLAFRFIGMPAQVGMDIESSPYAFAVADWRCFYASTGACTASPQRGEDGYDLVQWLAGQAWSDGQVGTWGASALGQIQYMTAREQPPALKAIMPMVCDPQTYYAKYYPGGILREEYLNALDFLGFGLSLFVLPLPSDNAVWDFTAADSWYPDAVEVPSFSVGGWFDHNQQANLRWFQGLRAESPAAVQATHKLLMGPWAHGGLEGGGVDAGFAGELNFPDAADEADRLGRAFFDHYLRGIENGWETGPFITYYQPGAEAPAETWRSSPRWPPFDSLRLRLYLEPGSSRENGVLSGNTPAIAGTTAITADPTDPSPSIGGRVLFTGLDQGPFDQAVAVESRADALLFTSAPLAADLELQGPVRLRLQASTSQLDADVLVRITDVLPDGRSVGILEGGRRIRHRDGFTNAETALAIPDAVYPINIQLQDMAYTLAAGHQLRIVVTGHNWPQFDRNLQNGGPVLSAGDSLSGELRIHSGPVDPSWIELLVSDAYTALASVELETKDLHLHPNPAHSSIWAKASLAQRTRSWRIFGMDGREMASGTWPAGTTELRIDLNGLSPGPYQLALEGQAAQRFIVE